MRLLMRLDDVFYIFDLPDGYQHLLVRWCLSSWAPQHLLVRWCLSSWAPQHLLVRCLTA